MASRSSPARKSPIRFLLVSEAVVTALSAIAVMVAPTPLLRLMLNTGLTYPLSVTNEPSPAAVQLFQWSGAFMLMLCVPLVLSAGENARAKASRRMTYQLLGSGELILVVLLLVQSTSSGAGAVSKKFLWASAAMLGSIVLGRGWIFGWRPEWFEDNVVSGHKRRSSNR